MRLDAYLAARGESYRSFGVRTDTHGDTIRRIAEGGWPQLRVADRIVEASRAEPAPDGATVTIEDLITAARDASQDGV